MNATQPLTVPTESSAGDDDLTHVFCRCNPTLGLCGVRVDGDPDDPEEWDSDAEPDLCVVCDDLLNVPCERCGCP